MTDETFDPMDSTEQDKKQSRRDLLANLARKEEDSDLKWLMKDRRGRRIVWRQLSKAGVFQSSFNTSAMTMAFAEGRRNEGLNLLSEIHRLCPTLYTVMVEEQNNDRNNNSGS
jgi:hypothetical protein